MEQKGHLLLNVLLLCAALHSQHLKYLQENGEVEK